MKQKRIINIAFCFDKNFLMQACVSITSLLVSAKNKCGYNIYCIVSKDLTPDDLECLKEIAREFSKNSKIIFLYENGNYDNAYIPANINILSKAIFYRFMLPELLQDIDKVIYIDSDTIILKDLIQMDDISLNDNLLAGCQDFMNDFNIWSKNFNNYWLPLKKNGYVNSGVLIMNLKKMRYENLSKKWIKLSHKKTIYPDQDILNSTCLNRIVFLDSKYNIEIFTKIKPDINSKKIKNTAILHYIYPKPWLQKNILSDIWWKYAKMTKFYNQLTLSYAITIKNKTVY